MGSRPKKIKGVDTMNVDNLQKVSFTKLEQGVMELLRKYANGNKELEDDLFKFIEAIKQEQRKADEIKSLAFLLANKL